MLASFFFLNGTEDTMTIAAPGGMVQSFGVTIRAEVLNVVVNPYFLEISNIFFFLDFICLFTLVHSKDKINFSFFFF